MSHLVHFFVLLYLVIPLNYRRCWPLFEAIEFILHHYSCRIQVVLFSWSLLAFVSQVGQSCPWLLCLGLSLNFFMRSRQFPCFYLDALSWMIFFLGLLLLLLTFNWSFLFLTGFASLEIVSSLIFCEAFIFL